MAMMPFRLSRRALLAAAPLLAVPLGGGIAAAAESDFSGFLAGVRRDASAQGIRAATIDIAFRYIQYLPHVIELDRKQAEHKLSFAEYLAKVVTPQRLDDARRQLVDNWGLLQRVRQRFSVQPGFVVALWGVESDFGRTMGSYSVPAALATLAYDGRRGSLFRGELIAALKILDQAHIRADNMVGSWAGAMGQCQFMPSTFLSYAVDFDGDGRRDIWTDRSDVLGSIANYISRLGWRGNEGWGREVVVPGNFDTRLAGLETRRPTAEWSRLGVRPAGAAPFTGREPDASLVMPDGIGGTVLLVYDNFRAIMKWNKSTYFAAAVGYIADSADRG
jgi:membrane-bound lytic murein transglycosylase B